MAVAGALSATAFATTVGLGANLGLFGITEPDSTVGRLDTSRPASALEHTPAAPPTTVPGIATSAAETGPVRQPWGRGPDD
jgi:hypothetical protein